MSNRLRWVNFGYSKKAVYEQESKQVYNFARRVLARRRQTMVDLNNAAGRLYTLLNRLRSTGKNTAIQHAWAEIFGVDKDDLDQIIILNAEIVKLTEETKNLILKQDVNHDLYLKPFIKIQRVFALSLGHQVQNALEFLDEATMVGLEHCAELLSRTAMENQIEESVLNDLLNEIARLEKSILESTISVELKALLLDSLLEIKKAILYYRIHGAKGIEKAVKNTFGSVNYYRINNLTTIINNEIDKKTLLDYVGFIADIISIVSAGMNIPLLKDNISNFLLGSGK